MRGDRCECGNSRGIGLLSVVGGLFGGVLIEGVGAGAECAMGEEQCGFGQGVGCMNQVFGVGQVCEEYLANGRDVFWAFVDLEKAYDTVDRHGMRHMLGVCGVGGRLLKAVPSFYVDSRACVWVGNVVSEWFLVNLGLRQGCVISPWLFNVYVDGVVREVNVGVLGKGWSC